MSEEERNQLLQELLQHTPQDRAEYILDLTEQTEYLNENNLVIEELKNQLDGIKNVSQQISLFTQKLDQLTQKNQSYEEKITNLEKEITELKKQISEHSHNDSDEDQEPAEKVEKLDLSNNRYDDIYSIELHKDLYQINLKRNNLSNLELISILEHLESKIKQGLSSQSKKLNIYVGENNLNQLDMSERNYTKTNAGFFKHLNGVVISIIL